ncbi:MAG: peptidoglycan binding domain-containing protein, partial [Polyangiaceae bacterium]
MILAGLAAFAGMRAHAAFFPDGEVLPGLTIEHRAVTGSVSEAVAGAARNRVAQEARFQIDGDTVLDASFADLGVSVDETRTASVARAIGHEGDLASRADQAKRATRGEIDVPLAMRVDPSRLLALLAPVKELRDQAPTSARVDFNHGGAKAEAP